MRAPEKPPLVRKLCVRVICDSRWPAAANRAATTTRAVVDGLIAWVPALDRWLDQAGVDAQGTKRRSGLNVSRQRELRIADLNHGCLRSSPCAPAPSTLDARLAGACLWLPGRIGGAPSANLALGWSL
jgi:hypothetical protein